MSARLSNKSPVVAKVSTNAFQLEREFYVIKKLYQKDEAPLYLGTNYDASPVIMMLVDH